MRLTAAKSLAASAVLLTGVVAVAQSPVVATSTPGVRTPVVASIAGAGAADLVVLDGGHADGWRQGMTATVERDGVAIAQLRVADLRRARAVAPITGLEAESSSSPATASS